MWAIIQKHIEMDFILPPVSGTRKKLTFISEMLDAAQ